jgi:acetyl esterase/lipase
MAKVENRKEASRRPSSPQLVLLILVTIGALGLVLSHHLSGAQSPTQLTPAPPDTSTIQQNVLFASVKGTDLHLDVYQPAGSATGARPAVVLIHGGGWTSLDKGTMRGMGKFLARSGFVGFAVDYRLLQDKQNRWPAQLDDVQRAVRWVRANAAQYNIDPNHIGAFGHSAGGQLAALLGMEDTRDNSDPALAQYSSKVQAVVDVSGPSDFTVDPDREAEFLTNFLGVSFAQNPGAWRDASPVFHAAKDNAPFLIVHGTEDKDVPISQSQELFDKLQAAGVPASFIKVNDGHTFQTPDARRELAVQAQSFFNRYLVVGH